MRLNRLAWTLSLAQTAFSQAGSDLLTTIATYPELSQFSRVLSDNPSLITLIPTNSTHGVNLLVPNNDAFQKYFNETGSSFDKASNATIVSILKYHVMMANLTGQNFTQDPRGITVPTLLRDEQYNNRTAGVGLVDKYGKDPAQGQVVYISKDPINPAKLRVRQQNASNVNLRGGLGEVASVEPVNVQWSLGYIQITDTILTPPTTCSTTIRSIPASLTGLDNALNRSVLYPVLDHAPNVTCLAPSSEAFKNAGSPDKNLNSTELTNALLFHTLHEVAYTDYLTDGMKLESAAGLDVLVTIKGNDIYFNDAKVISPNILTNNGLLHVLDKVMSPLNETANSTSTSTATVTGSGTAGSTSTASATSSATPSSSSNTGSMLTGSMVMPGLVTFVSGWLVLF